VDCIVVGLDLERPLIMGDGFVHVPVASQGVTEAIARIRLAEIGSRARNFAPWRLGAKTAECRPCLRILSLFAAIPLRLNNPAV